MPEIPTWLSESFTTYIQPYFWWIIIGIVGLMVARWVWRFLMRKVMAVVIAAFGGGALAGGALNFSTDHLPGSGAGLW